MSELLRARKAEVSLDAAATAASKAVGHPIRVRSSAQRRIAPNEFSEAVEHYARQHGGHARIEWVPAPANVWRVMLTLKPGDPRMKAGQTEEAVTLHEWVSPDPTHPSYPWHDLKKLDRLRRNNRNQRIASYVSLELEELGPTGMVEMLEKGSLLSGRGEFKSPEAAMHHVLHRHRMLQERRRLQLKSRNKDRLTDERRRILKIPFLPVGIELGRPNKKER